METIKDIKKAIDSMDVTLMQDTLAYLLKVYVLDRGFAYEGVTQSPQTAENLNGSALSFAEIIQQLKNRYTLDELNLFSIDGKNVSISLEGRTYQLTGSNTGKSTVHEESKKDDNARNEKKSDNGFSPSGRFEKLELE
ncbi:MAG: hypothetical protein JXJ04_25725 [Spirochaetales bacterium]|nr:hypothetical protein [Spirochaetales bacterium]